ncbi:MAG: signal peptidase I [Lachnospiraceae bacterium]|nr:signal peptidase I [Lachnospiraceae bacterium]
MKYDFDLESQRGAKKKLIIQILLTIGEAALVIFLAFLLTHYGFEVYTVTGHEMKPTLIKDDRILVNKLVYRIGRVKRNDIVIVKQSGTEHNYYSVERVLGLPGERVRIRDGRIYIDGKKLKEKFAFPRMENGGLALEEITLEDDEYFLLCDNRNNGEDSRNANIGNVLRENILGKAWFRLNTMEFVNFLDAFSEEDEKGSSAQDSAS